MKAVTARRTMWAKTGEVKKESKKEGGKECGVRRVLVVVRTEERGDPKAERACREVREGGRCA